MLSISVTKYFIIYEHETIFAQVVQHESLMKDMFHDSKILGILILASRDKLKNFLSEEKYIDKILENTHLGGWVDIE